MADKNIRRPGLRKSMMRQSMLLTQDQIEDMKKVFATIDDNQSGHIDLRELGKALELVGIKIPGYELRDMVAACDREKDEVLDLEEFKDLYAQLKMKYDVKGQLHKLIKPPTEEMVVVKQETSLHTVRVEEQMAFSNWIMINFKDDLDCARHLPLAADGSNLYEKCKDGILICKLINFSQPGTIHEQAMNKPNKPGGSLSVYQAHENLTLAIRSAQSIGVNVVNIGPDDLYEGTKHLVLGLIWQIIRIGLLAAINLVHHKELVALLEEGETLEELMQLSPEQILIRWVNYQLNKAQCGRQISNFTGDIKDSVAYIHLLNQIAPADAGVGTTALQTGDLHERAELMLREADKLKCRVFLTPSEVTKGTYNLNLAFVAYLFNRYPALEMPSTEVVVIEETREEKTYRNWMNSMGVNPRVHYLYRDLIDGLTLFQLYEIIQPGVVDWKRVVKDFKKRSIVMEMIGNCNYAVELGKSGEKLNFSLVGIAGKDIYDGNKTLTLALLWQLMKAYTLSLLNKLKQHEHITSSSVDKDIVVWANNKLNEAGKGSKLSSFSDPVISRGRVIADLIDAIKPGSINYSVVKAGDTDEEKLDNAKYAISIAWRRGARIYALPEDIVEVKSKMVMTIFACLMILDQEDQK
jgi:plastin-3